VTFALCSGPKWQRLPAGAVEALKPPPLFGHQTQPELFTTFKSFEGHTLDEQP